MKRDNELQGDVMDELNWEPSVNSAHIGVTAKDGVVTLTGHVPSYGEKYGAERAAQRVYGVRAVANELDVRLLGSAHRTDEEIAASCLHSLRASLAVPDERIKVLVRSGRVVLSGHVQWRYQRDAAEAALRDIAGVQSISNDITIEVKPTPADVKNRIEAAFRRSAEIDARRIHVDAREGKVVLRGHVRSASEREEALHAAWAAPGVVTVQNDLSISP